jgi:hypothetical protein
MSTNYFTPEIRFDANYIIDFNHPEDDSMGGLDRDVPLGRVPA